MNNLSLPSYNKRSDGRPWHVRPAIICADGFKMSVQASEYHYCTPRITGAEQYTEVEVGFPSQKEDLLMDYADDCDRPTDTVYGYVPVEVVIAVINKHGGLQQTLTNHSE